MPPEFAVSNRRAIAAVWVGLLCILSLAGFLHLANFSCSVNSRIGAPHAIELNEPIMLDLVVRAKKGLPLYPTESLAFIPVLYPPLYSYFSALLFSNYAPSFYPMRFVSLASAFGVLLFTFLQFRKLGWSFHSSLAFIALFVSFYEKSACWYDVARVDMLALFFLSVGVWALVSSGKACLYVGISSMVLSIYTKQTNAPFAIILIAVIYRKFGMKGTWAPFLVLAASWIPFFAVEPNSISYLFLRPTNHPFFTSQIDQFLNGPLVPILFLVWSRFLFQKGKAMTPDLEFFFWMLFGLSTVLGFAGSLKIGGALNHFIPTHYFLCILMAASIEASVRNIKSGNGSWSCQASLIFAVGILVFNWYPPSKPIKNFPLLEQKINLVDYLARKTFDGPVFFFECRDNYLGILAGHSTAFNYQAYLDLIIARELVAARKIDKEVEAAIRTGQFGCIIVSGFNTSIFPIKSHDGYRRETNISNEVPFTVWVRDSQ